jgi:protein-S-isoprenylcysteine O-methyltransferase Ste14
MDINLIARYAVRVSLNIAGMGVALFWAAGRLDWWPAWAALAVMLAWLTAMPIVSWRTNPALLAEYLGIRKGGRTPDSAIISALGLIQLLRYIVAGLDQRYQWTGEFSLTAQLAALLVCCLGYALFVWATASNAYFSQTLRIQTERGHTVATSGPYSFVRHPAYLGALLFELAVPILLASGWSLIFSGMTAILLILRTALEDRTLQTGLAGYGDYARDVRYRLVPGIW